MARWQRMRSVLNTRSVVGTTAFVAGMGIVGGGLAYAAIPSASGAIQGCYTNASPHVLRVIDTTSTPKCPSGTTALAWNQSGPRGVTGATGAKGATGAAGPAGVSTAYLLVRKMKNLDAATFSDSFVIPGGWYQLELAVQFTGLDGSPPPTSGVVRCQISMNEEFSTMTTGAVDLSVSDELHLTAVDFHDVSVTPRVGLSCFVAPGAPQPIGITAYRFTAVPIQQTLSVTDPISTP